MALRRFPFVAIKTLNQQIKVKVQRLLIDIKSITSVALSLLGIICQLYQAPKLDIYNVSE